MPRLPFWPTAITALAVATMFALGAWQLARLEWKSGLIARLEAAKTLPALNELPQGDNALRMAEFRAIALRGHFLHDNEFHLSPRYYQGAFGYDVLTPFSLKDGRMVLVDRGWVPAEKKDPATRREGNAKGEVKIAGRLRVPYPPVWKLLSDRPEKNLWFFADLPAMRAHSGLDLAPGIVEITGGENPGGLPVAHSGEIRLRNDHLAYAITWCAIGVMCAVIYSLYIRKKFTA